MAYKNNSIKLTGNLTTDVNLKTVQVGGSDRSCATFGLAVHTNDNRTDFFRVTSWGNQADRDAKYLKKEVLLLFLATSPQVSLKKMELKCRVLI